MGAVASLSASGAYLLQLTASKPADCSDIQDLETAKAELQMLRSLARETVSHEMAGNGVSAEKRKRMIDRKVFVLDNSLRESTVGQSVGHSVVDKHAVLKCVHNCGFKHMIIGAFSHQRRVDDAFAETFKDWEKSYVGAEFYAFTEDSDAMSDGSMLFGENYIPIGLQKMAEYGIRHPIIEIDLADDSVRWESDFTVSKLMELITFLLEWTNEHLTQLGKTRPRAMVNIRDLPIAMLKCPERVDALVAGLASLPTQIRPKALLYEEPTGEYLPDEVGCWTRRLRRGMDAGGWTSRDFQSGGPVYTSDGLLLVHIHKQWGLADAVVLEAIAEGADGVWASIAEEGAAQGHACSAVTLANLARLGNHDVVERYNTTALANSARKITRVTTNQAVSARQIVYGPRAIEAVFGFSGIAGGALDRTFDRDGDGDVDIVDHFTLAEFFGVEEPPVRISTLSTPGLVVKRLEQCFGPDTEHFTDETASILLAEMKRQLENNQEHECTSLIGLASLWAAAGFAYPDAMQAAVDASSRDVAIEKASLLKEAEECFRDLIVDGSSLLEGKEPALGYNEFYNGYLQAYMGCFSCPRTRFVLDAIDLNDDGNVTWGEWRFWCTWALREFPNEIHSLDELHNTVLRQVIIPNSLRRQNRAGALVSGI